ncbi:hypothetical protein B0O99DRAFT_738682 [Bisporella sp. PMI_857]|nr:hypothetical protein B0O99DRAFT_738682 [Bisporella sp. PMI_857]
MHLAAISPELAITGTPCPVWSRQETIWQPLFDSAINWPLALHDGSTVNPPDLLAIDQIRRHWRGEAFCPLYKPHYRWYYLQNQRVDEALFLKNFDSRDVPAKFAPYSSLQSADIPKDASKRSSIEVRAMAFTFPN